MADKKKNFSGPERRKTERRPVLESFSLSVVVPKKGVHRLPIHDLSEQGIGFDLDTEGEDIDAFPAEKGEEIDIHLYLNRSLFIPLTVKLAQVHSKNEIRRVGVEIKDRGGKAGKALDSFVKMMDQILDVAQFSEVG